MAEKSDKHSIYMTDELYDEITNEAARQNRSFSWMLKRAWLLAKSQITKAPAFADLVATSPQGESDER